MEAWRLIRSCPADGFTNMAVDEAILLAHAHGQVPPTLRLYAWRPPAISVGYFQCALRDVNQEACARDGIGVVRRLTGGRAVFHADEVTYSIVLTEAILSAKGQVRTLLDSYRFLCGGLVAGLRRLGLEATVAPRRKALDSPSGPNCFAAAASGDLLVDGKKICGSAQTRRYGVVLQHGSLPLSLPDATPYWREAGAVPHATDLTRALGRRPSWDEVAQALAAGFAEALGVRWVPGALTEYEHAVADQLRREKYATHAWNYKR